MRLPFTEAQCRTQRTISVFNLTVAFIGCVATLWMTAATDDLIACLVYAAASLGFAISTGLAAHLARYWHGRVKTEVARNTD